ncbi:MAG: HlyC/CorC family transporter [Proteobacteria bacterium]|nr:HlyC/CorC family transporter [Pseudomonadota bacterium]
MSAFFSGTESAFVSLGEIDLIDISKSVEKNAKILAKLLDNREKLLSTILIGNNVVNIAATALNTTLAIHYSHGFGISEELGVTISAAVLAVVILIFGEIAPKTIAIAHNRRLSLFTAPLIMALGMILSPINFFFNKISKFINFIFVGESQQESTISESTVINVVSKGEEMGVIGQTEKNLIENVFLFDEREVYPVMTPRTAVFALSDTLTLGEVQDDLLEKQFSRIPVYAGSIDNITGIINLKTVFRNLLADQNHLKLKELAQKPLFVYETLSLSSLLEKFKASQNHMAIVVDEFGGMAGIVTLEDILEELVGEIYDEKDEVSSLIRKVGERKWLVNGKTDIVTLNKSISGEIVLDGEFETLQGLIMSALDRLPVVGDSLFINPHQFVVKKMKQNEIISVIVEYTPKEDPADNEEKE